MTIRAHLFNSSVLFVAVCLVTLMSILHGIFLHRKIYNNNIINISNIDRDFELNLQEKNSVGGTINDTKFDVIDYEFYFDYYYICPKH